MKTLLPFIAVFLVILASDLRAQTDIFHLLRKYKNDSGVLYFDAGSMLRKKLTADSKMSSQIVAADVYIFEGVNDVNASDKQKINSFVSSKSFDVLIDAKQKGSNTKLFVREKGDFLEELVGIVHYDKYRIYIFAKGKLVYEELSKLGLNFDQGGGLELFEDIQKKN